MTTHLFVESILLVAFLGSPSDEAKPDAGKLMPEQYASSASGKASPGPEPADEPEPGKGSAKGEPAKEPSKAESSAGKPGVEAPKPPRHPS